MINIFVFRTEIPPTYKHLFFIYFIDIKMYQCPRCHYQTIKKHDLKCHFYRKKPCSPIYSTITQRILQQDVKKRNCFKITEDNNESNENNNESNLNHIIINNDNTRKIDNDNYNNSINTNNENIKYKCDYCNKISTTSSNNNRHMRTCKIRKKIEEEKEKNKNDENTILKHHNQQLQKEIFRLQTELQNALSVKGNNKTNNKPNIVNNYYTQNNFNQNNIKINAFREEKTDYLTPEYIMGIAKRGMYYAIPKLIEKIYFNENHPENQNVKITNEKSKYGEIFDGTRFIKCAKNLIVKDMIHVAIDIIDEVCCDVDMPTPYNEFSKKYDNGDRILMNSLYKKAEGIALTYSKF